MALPFRKLRRSTTALPVTTNPLTGKYDNFYKSAKVYDQKFGLILTADNLKNPAKMSLSYGPDTFYPWRSFASSDSSSKKDPKKQEIINNYFAVS